MDTIDMLCKTGGMTFARECVRELAAFVQETYEAGELKRATLASLVNTMNLMDATMDNRE